MAVTDASDNDLRTLLFAHDMVIVMYYDTTCANCKLLAPIYESLSNAPAYKDIKFLKIRAEESTVANKIVKSSGNAFCVIYKKGFLIRCSEIQTEKGLKKLLKELKDEVRPIFSQY